MYTNLLLEKKTHPETIIPPLMLIYIGNRCEGYSNNIDIHSETSLTSKLDTSVRHKFFVGFNDIYQNIICCGV